MLEWSDYVTGTVYSSGYIAKYGFNGDSNTRAGGSLKFEPPTPIKCEKVRVWQSVSASSYTGVKLNGVQIPDPQQTSGSIYNNPNDYDVTEFASWESVNSGDEPGWWNKMEVMIDGEWIELIDKSVGGDGNVTKVISTGYPNSNTMVVDGGNWDTTNRSEVWSESITNTGGGWQTSTPATLGFDGNVETRAVSPNDGITTFRPNTAIPITQSLEYVTKWGATSGYSIRLSIDGVEQTIEGTTTGKFESFGNLVGKQIDSNTPLRVEWLRPNGTVANSTFSTLKVDGKVLVDAIDNRADWENLLVASTAFNNNKINAFDGDTTTGPIITGQTTTWTFDASQHFENGSFQIFTFGYQKIDVVDSVGTREVFSGDGGGSLTWWPQTPAAFTGVQSIILKPQGLAGSNSNNFNAIKINGKVLISNTLPNSFGATKVTLQTNGGQGTVDTVDTSTNSIVITPTGNSLNRWISTNKAGTTFYAGSPTKPAVSQKAYLKFTGAGVVESVSAAPVAPQAMESRNPTLIFPATFDTGNNARC